VRRGNAEVGVSVTEGKGKDEKVDEKRVEVPVPPGVLPVGSVGQSFGMTINLGNFESGRVDGWATMPVLPEGELEKVLPAFSKAWETCSAWLNEKVGKEISGLRNLKGGNGKGK
jgi:hypothetical protein